jgi:nodulation protein E
MSASSIAVTGVGCISPLGNSFPEFSRQLFSAECGIGPITLFEPAELAIKVAAEVRNYDETAHFDQTQCRNTDRFAQFAMLAAREAVADSRIIPLPPERTAVILGTAVGGHTALDFSYYRFYAEKAKRLHPYTVPKIMASSAVSWVGIEHGVKGPVFSTTSACASSGHAIALSAMFLRTGMADVVVTGGSDACITPGLLKGWEGLRVMAQDTCRPFSKGRGGMVLGEGAAVLVLERADEARRRGARLHAELVGVGMSSDAYHMIQPSVDGAEIAMRNALNDAGIEPSSVDYINAHGTGTIMNDTTEAAAIHRLFGEKTRRLPVSSSKSQFGHLMGGASAIESLAVIAGIQARMAPPTVNFLGADPDCDLDCVPNAARPLEIETALSNSFAFGGLNVSLIYRKAAS